MRSYRGRWAFRVLGERLRRAIRQQATDRPIRFMAVVTAWALSYIPIRLAIEWIRPGG